MEENDLVFCTLRGRYLAPQNVVVNFKKLLKQAGLPGQMTKPESFGKTARVMADNAEDDNPGH